MRIKLLCLSVLLVSLAGCDFPDPFDALPDHEPNPCRGSSGDLTGIWTVTGTGTRSECGDRSLNGDFRVNTLELDLVHEMTENTLDLADPEFGSAVNFALSGGVVDGICASFQTDEMVGDQHLTFSWSGDLENDRKITGKLTGSGPSGCVAEGNFVMIR